MRYRTACGNTIVVPWEAQEHLRAHPEVWKYLSRAIGRVTLPGNGQFLATAVDMGRVVGRSGCVVAPRIGVNDRALFAQRVNRMKPSRVAIGARGERTTKIVVLAYPTKDDPRTYVLVTSFIGELTPKEPWDPSIASEEELNESLAFWNSHALVFDPVVMGSVTATSWAELFRS